MIHGLKLTGAAVSLSFLVAGCGMPAVSGTRPTGTPRRVAQAQPVSHAAVTGYICAVQPINITLHQVDALFGYAQAAVNAQLVASAQADMQDAHGRLWDTGTLLGEISPPAPLAAYQTLLRDAAGRFRLASAALIRDYGRYKLNAAKRDLQGANAGHSALQAGDRSLKSVMAHIHMQESSPHSCNVTYLNNYLTAHGLTVPVRPTPVPVHHAKPARHTPRATPRPAPTVVPTPQPTITVPVTKAGSYIAGVGALLDRVDMASADLRTAYRDLTLGNKFAARTFIRPAGLIVQSAVQGQPALHPPGKQYVPVRNALAVIIQRDQYAINALRQALPHRSRTALQTANWELGTVLTETTSLRQSLQVLALKANKAAQAKKHHAKKAKHKS